jgi:hypothetical protein
MSSKRAGANRSPQERIFPRGFYVYTDNIWDSNAWSDPVYFDNPGFDQDVSCDTWGLQRLYNDNGLAVLGRR